MNIYDLKTNHIKNPLGYHMDRVSFSWKVENAVGKKQKAARILVCSDEKMEDILFDSGYDAQADSRAYPVELALSPRTRYYWKVTVWTDAEEEEKSETAWFETGKMEEAWKGQWISCDNTIERHPVFEKEIVAQKEIQKARLYICGLGLYEASINGEKIGNEFMTPYFNGYHQWVQYQTYDITDQLKGAVEKVQLSVLLGNGWFIWKREPGHKDTGHYREGWKLLAEVIVTYVDGTEEIIGTDESWSVRRSNITLSNIYDGQQEDDTLEALPGEKAVLTKPPKGRLEARYSVPVTAKETFTPAQIIHTPAGELVVDLGQEISGTFRLHVQVPRGTKVTVQTGEVLQKGNFYRENLRSAKSEYIYISDGTEKVVMPQFTFYGYRYAKIEGIPDLKPEDFTGVAFYSDIPRTGSLKTGHELLNRLISNIEWSMKDNFVDVPTDCPQRDERQGWTGDAQVFSGTAMYLADTYAFYRKYLHDLAMEQKALGGKVPDIIPSRGKESAEAVWGDAAVLIPWNLYQMYGDKQILIDQYESMKSWVDYVQKVDGEDFGWRRTFQYGDWLALDGITGRAEDSFGGTDEGYIASIYFAYSAEIVAKTAVLLGHPEDAETYRKIAKCQWDGVRREYFSATGRCCVDTQTGLLLALKHHLSTDEDALRERLRMLFEKCRNTLRTGFVGTPIMCKVLSENGMRDIAYKILLGEEYPGWLHEVKLGATTIWERWNSLDAEGNISGTGMNSLNHYSYGSILEWMFGYMAGIKIDDMQAHTKGTRFADTNASDVMDMAAYTGGRFARIEPEINWYVGYLEAVHESAAGRYVSSWKIEDAEHVTVKVEVPFNCEADLILPYAGPEIYGESDNPMFTDAADGVCHLQAGTYEVTYHTTVKLKNKYSTQSTIQELLENSKVCEALKPYVPIEMAGYALYKNTLRDIMTVLNSEIPEAAFEALDQILSRF